MRSKLPCTPPVPWETKAMRLLASAKDVLPLLEGLKLAARDLASDQSAVKEVPSVLSLMAKTHSLIGDIELATIQVDARRQQLSLDCPPASRKLHPKNW